MDLRLTHFITEREFAKAATKAQTHHEASAMRHEERGVKLAAAAQFHHQAALESQSEANRAQVISSLPIRGTLPMNSLNNSGSFAPMTNNTGAPIVGPILPMNNTTAPMTNTSTLAGNSSYNTIV